ncbi:alpha/beta fold hydrolase [Planococcus sp. 1R117A]|uniref:alpha/beta fold hydrolase n=1 Tax=Planococcus sp. 1R117A TaxID=3447020 RepID=UPI003EDC00A0
MKLSYKEYGNQHAPLMIFIHGGGVGGWMWDRQVRHFSSYHVVVPELDILENASPFSIHASADHIIALIEEKRQNKPVIAIGFSLGAQILLAVLGKKPDLVDYAMVNSALVKSWPFTDALIQTSAFFQPLAKSKAFSRLQAKSLYIEEPYFETYYRDSSRLRKQELAVLLKENMSFTLPSNFKLASADILVTVGEKERSIMKESTKEIRRSNPNCRALMFPEIGHGISLAKPKLFNRVIDHWLADIEFPDEVMAIND